ncbi:helix-turn-helix transcriptional regulator [Cellulomonas sp. URHB0016]
MARGPMSTPFVARAGQVSELMDGLDRAGRGVPGLVLLAADAGVGKTRLVQHVAGLATAAGARVAVAHCVDLGEIGLPYLPFSEALARLREVDPEAVGAVVRDRPVLGRLLPGGGPDEDGGDDRTGRLQLFDGLTEVLGAVGRPGHPLLLVLEDLHWADASSRDVLRFLVARLRDQHVLVVATYRTDDLHRRHPWRAVAGELARHPRVTRMDLHPFTPDELRDFTTAVTGGPVPEGVLHRVQDRSDGNAYFAEELLAASNDGDALPWSLADVLRSRLEVLEPAVQRLVGVASVAGRRVSEPLLRAAAAAAGDPLLADPGDVDAALRDAVAHHVLGGEDGQIAFRHALLAEAVYTELLPGEQSSLHRAYLAALAADPALGSSAQLAFHAVRVPDLPTALRASRAAATQARQMLAPVEELRHLEVVLRLWDGVQDAGELLADPHVDVLAAAAEAASLAGQLDRAVQLSRAAMQEAPAGSERRATLRTGLARHLLSLDDVHDALHQAQRALDELPASPSPSRARALATYAHAALSSDLADEATQAATEAADMAKAIGAADAESDALTSLAVLVVHDADRAARLLADALDRARAAGDVAGELRSTFNLASHHYYAGEIAGSIRILDAGAVRARETGTAWSPYGVQLVVFGHLFRYVSGDLAPVPTRGVVPDEMAATLQATALYSAVARGDEDAVEQGRALERAWGLDGYVALVGGGTTVDALTWRGEPDEAVALLQRVVDHVATIWTDAFLGGIWLCALGLAALADAAAQERLAGKDVTPRLQLGEQLLARAVRTADIGRPRGGALGPEGRGWLARAHAEHARLTGSHDPGLWRAALAEFSYGYRYEQARTRWRLAESLLEQGSRELALDEAAAALAEADEMGAVPLATAVRGLARRGRLDLPGVRAGGTGLLTAREAEVLELVAHGLSNRQIGEKLFISGKTVSVHVSNLLAKLGVSGRAEAVSVAHRRGLIGTD